MNKEWAHFNLFKQTWVDNCSLSLERTMDAAISLFKEGKTKGKSNTNIPRYVTVDFQPKSKYNSRVEALV